MTRRERFWKKVVIQKINEFFECWEWTGAKAHGYGRFWDGTNVIAAHRFAFEDYGGVIPEGSELDHLCRNRGCVNPAHLEPVTHHDNLLRGEGFTGKLARRTHCGNGHPLTLENVYLRNGARYCRTCRLNAQRRRTERHVPKDPTERSGICKHCGVAFTYIGIRSGEVRASCSEPCRLELRRKAVRESKRRRRVHKKAS